MPPLQQTTNHINNAYIHGAPVQPTGVKVSVYCNKLVVNAQIKLQEATHENDFRFYQTGLRLDHLVSLDQPTQRSWPTMIMIRSTHIIKPHLFPWSSNMPLPDTFNSQKQPDPNRLIW